MEISKDCLQKYFFNHKIDLYELSEEARLKGLKKDEKYFNELMLHCDNMADDLGLEILDIFDDDFNLMQRM